MIFRLSNKLSQKIKVKPESALPLDIHPLADWSAHVFISDRAQYLILTNTASLFTIILPGRGITTANQFASKALAYMAGFLRDSGYDPIYQECIEPYSASVHFSKPLNRGVIGSMTDYVKHAQFISIDRGVPPDQIVWLLNIMPMFYLEGDCIPDSRFRTLAKEAGCQVAKSPSAQRAYML